MNLLRFFGRSCWLVVFVSAMALVMAGCASDDVDEGESENGDTTRCAAGEEWNPIHEACEPSGDDPPSGPQSQLDAGNDGQNSDDSQGDAGDEDSDVEEPEPGSDTDLTTEPDVEPEPEPDTGPPINCEDYTTLSGKVTIPAGNLPLPEATVYIPDGPLQDFPQGASCQRCGEELSTTAVMDTITDVNGDFQLQQVPVAEDIPLVVEVGKWRRKTVVPEVNPCGVTDVDPSETRLPRNSDEGHLPRIAVTTGECDALECLIRKIGISDSEITTDDGDGRVHLFSGRLGTERFADDFNDGAAFSDATQWWTEADNLLEYDIVVHSCECDTYVSDKEDGMEAFQEFVDSGGRAFLSHLHYAWLRSGTSDMQSVADWRLLAAPGGMDQSATGYINDSFPKGQILYNWMHNTGTNPPGEFDIYEVRGSVDSINEDLVQDWISIFEDGSLFPGQGGQVEEFIQYFSFNTPVGIDEEDQCGRVVFSDIHVSAREMSMGSERDISSPDHPYPTGCVTDDFSDQEKALVYMFFDLSACIIPDGVKKGEW